MLSVRLKMTHLLMLSLTLKATSMLAGAPIVRLL